ncbi:MAG: rhodanese-like domain-containing protein, partial [Gemmatimonadales bacterium]
MSSIAFPVALVGFALLAGAAMPVVCQLPTGQQLVISPQAAAKFVNDGKTVFLQVGEKKSYDQEHVPGARFVTLNTISAPRVAGGLALEMPGDDSLRLALQRLGISDDSRVVVMFSDEWGSPSTRVLFTLGYAGLGANAYLMDGGVEAWKRAGLPLTADVPTPSPGRITRRTIPSLIVDHSYVESMTQAARPGHARLVDGRDSVFFAGTSTDRVKVGHIPGAVSLPFGTFTDDSMRILPKTQIEKIFLAAGIAPGDTVVAYCHIGQQGTMVLWAARIAGHPVKLYDGSM